MVRKALVFLVCGWICTNFMGVGLAHEPPQPAGQSGQGPSWLMGTYQSLVPPCYQGLIATVFGQDDAALACLAEAIQRDPHNSAVYLLRAWVYQDKVYLNQALADCTKALQLDPNQAVAYGFRGLAHCKKGDLDHAIADFTEALRLNPNHPGNLVYRGLCYSAKRDFDKAIQDFTAALQLNPLAARVHALRAAVYFAKQDLARAVDDLKAAHEIEPGNAEYLNVIDSFYLCTGRSQEAITAFTAAIDVDPKYAPAFVGRACIRMELGEYAGAIADNSQALRLDPDNASANENLAYLLATCPKASLRDGKKAVQLGRRACELTDWRDEFSISSLAAAFAEIGQFDEAIRLQKKALELAPLNRKEQRHSQLKLYQAGKPFRDSKTSAAGQK